MKKQISVIGCGWLGLPLAKFLISEGYKIKGSTTSKDKLKILEQAQINSFLIRLNEQGISGDKSQFFSGSETVIINISPRLRRNPNKNHVDEIKHLIAAIEEHEIKNILYISSTSVFKDEELFPLIDESTKPNAVSYSSKQLISIEQMLQSNPNFNVTILRFGGLFDEKRHPAKYLSGRKNISNPEAPINLIHKEDCINIIGAIIKNNIWDKTFNAVYPSHPSKIDYYSLYCKYHNIELPEFKSKGGL